ncbi:hypothetical protein N1031_03115 [Herbiconiux moechotypicola]|uniref:Uncharacterized protein n=1 Tax=Herbiconiux moechotypicola TaxID=637393 RepID=A0ABN3DCI4_9MICO|nr:hypothetical protein [Herbiconiux moechotypicola]MCS5728738.1 hypothetical protein [Herbiconiux moechotypicola]
MTATFDQVQASILALNGPERPFVYEATPTGVVGRWNYADQKWAALLGAGSVDADYVLEVVLDETESTFAFEEAEVVEETGLTAGGDGIGFSYERSTFKGHKKSYKFDLGAAILAKVTDRQGDHVGQSYGYRFDTDEIKDPLLRVFDEAGWEPRRKGLFSRLFGG